MYNYCHKQRSTLWLGTCPNPPPPPPPYKLSHKLKEKSNLINMLMIIVFFFLIIACHNSKCLLWVPNDRSSYSYMCVWRWTLYSLWESTLSSEWFCDTNLIRGCDINSVFCFFYRGPLRASNIFERIQLPWFSFELHFGLWHLSIPCYCLNTVNVLWAGL